MLANRPAFAMVFYGVLHAGAVVVPMDPRRSAGEVEFFLTNTGARLLVFAPSCGAAATAGAPAADLGRIGVGERTLEQLTGGFIRAGMAGDPRRDDNAVILHTSGASGVLKGALLRPPQPGQQSSRHCAQPAQHWARRRRAGLPATVSPVRDHMRSGGSRLDRCDAGTASHFRPWQSVGNGCGRTSHGPRGSTLHVRSDARGHRRPRI